MKAIMSLVFLVACLLLLLSMLSAAQVDARPCDGGLGHPNRGKNFILDLSSSTDSIRLSRQVFHKTGLDQVTITEGGIDKILRPNDMVSAAEFIAAKQVLLDGSQAIVLDGNGVATGGNFSVNEVIFPGHLSSMVIPAEVAGIWAADKPVYNITRVLQLLPEGLLIGVTGKKDALTLRMGSLDVGSLAKLTTIVTPELANMFNALSPNVGQTLDLNLFTQCACNNAGEISASGNLLINTKTNIVNSGTISSLQSVTLTGDPGRDLSIINAVNNVNGLISAVDDINFRLPNFSASSALNVAGGFLNASHINVNGGNGPATIDVVEIVGTVQGRAGSAAITTVQGTLDVGTFTTSRGGITLTAGTPTTEANIAINSDNDPNHLLAATKVGDIQITANNGDITMGNSTTISTAGGNIIALASGDISGGTGITLTANGVKTHGNDNLVGGGIHLGAGLTSSNELVTLLASQPAPFSTNASPSTLASIGVTLNHGATGLLRLIPDDGTGMSLNNGTININGGVVLLQTVGGSTITISGPTLNTFLPVSYVAETPAMAAAQNESVVDTGDDDPGVFDDEVVAANK